MAKEIDIKKLKQDLQTCIDELEKIEHATEHYAANMWPRLQETAGRCAAAINAIRLHQQGKASGEIAAELGMSKQQVAAYVAWNTMYAPGWAEKNKQRKLDEARKKVEQAWAEAN